MFVKLCNNLNVFEMYVEGIMYGFIWKINNWKFD